MRALTFEKVGQPLHLRERPPLEPGPAEVVVRLEAAALNRRDYWITRGLYPGLVEGVVPGSDGTGRVVRVGEGVRETELGREVIIDPSLDWGDRDDVQGPDYRILGMPDDGTLADEVVVPHSSLHDRPAHLSVEEAAALPLAGLTAYRALVTRGRCRSTDTVLISGIGGGVATMALGMARAIGARVLVTSSSPEKIERARALGAEAGIDYRDEDWHRKLRKEHGAPDLVIDGAGGKDHAHLVDLLAPGGRLVSYGATQGPPGSLDLFKVFWKQLDLLGSTMGSPADFAAMLELVESASLRPVIDRVLPLEKIGEALEALDASRQFGKIVLRTSES